MPENIDRRDASHFRIAIWIATGLGVGRIPIAPGTFGSLLGLPLAWGLGLLGRLDLAVFATVAVCLLGVPIVQAALPRLGRGKDPGCVVFDEIAGMAITLVGHATSNGLVLLLGFALFRLFDILKPPPARQLERLPGGWGVMADDWAAGIYANLTLRGILAIASSWGSVL